VTIYGVRRRVACYVTRTSAGGEELLVFDHVDDDPADPSGTQVPAGGMLPFEAVADAAIREVHEETGLEEMTYVEQLGAVELGLHDPGGPSVTTYVRLTTPSDGPSSWVHRVTGDGTDEGMAFACRWEPLPLSVDLAGGQDAFVDHCG
jgi:8-oxo-dGTP pyrophosphatase MutT (NUDIX family)